MAKNRGQSIVGYSQDRAEHDFYPTPPLTTAALLTREKFEGAVWECSSGNGAMSKVIEEYGIECISSDIRKGTNIYGEQGVDFLRDYRKVDNIVTNPPYSLAREFIMHALDCANKKVAMLLKLVFLEGVSRYDLFRDTPLKTVYVFCRRQKITKQGIEMKNSSMIAYAWFVWDKACPPSIKTTIEWIL